MAEVRESGPPASPCRRLRLALAPLAVLASLFSAPPLAAADLPEIQTRGTLRVLVVLDDAKSAAQVRPLLARVRGCATVITSRRPLGLLEADPFTVGGLDDDSLREPSVLPTRIPNLLVNGSEGIAVGNPAHLINELRKWEACGVDRVNFLLNAAENIPQEQVLNSLRLFAKEVMPAFADSRARAAAGGSR